MEDAQMPDMMVAASAKNPSMLKLVKRAKGPLAGVKAPYIHPW